MTIKIRLTSIIRYSCSCVLLGFAGVATVMAQQVDQQSSTEQMLSQIRHLQQTAAKTSTAESQHKLQTATKLANGGTIEYGPESMTDVGGKQGAGQGSLYQGKLYSHMTKKRGAGGTGGKTPPFRAPFQSAQPHRTSDERQVDKQAFKGTINNILPMTPDQIHRLKQLYTASQYAAAVPAGTPPKPTATSLNVDLSPGASPPAINLSEGDITALVFLDSTGAPWPIAAIDNGNPQSFNIQWNKTDNVLFVQSIKAFGHGNLAVRLRKLGPPVMITLITNTSVENGGGAVDYRVDMRVPGYGPNAKPLPVSGLPGTASPLLLNVLDGIPPDNSKRLVVANDAGQAWLVNNKVYLRTRYTLLSPGWLATMSSADGTNAYELQKTPLLLMSQNGKVTEIKIEGF